MIVVDAGAMLELLLRTDAGLKVEDLLASGGASAPDLLDADVFSGLIRARKRSFAATAVDQLGIATICVPSSGRHVPDSR